MKTSNRTWACAVAMALAACDNGASVVGRQDAAADLPAADVQPDVVAGVTPDVAPDVTPDVAADVTPDVTDAAVDAPADVTPDVTPDAGPPPLVRVVAECGTVCVRPSDAVLNAAGTAVFFTAMTATGQPAVFRADVPAVGAAPATPTVLAMGGGMEFPVGIAIANDDATLYVADLSATRGTTRGVGALFSLPATGGAPTAVSLDASLAAPSSIAVSADGASLLVTAVQRGATGSTRGVFRMARGGGAATAVGGALQDPIGVSEGAGGVLAVFDHRRGGPTSGTVLTVGGATGTEFVGGLRARFPAGVGYALDNRALLVSGRSSAGPALLTFVGSDGRASAPAELSMGMVAPRGLHRAQRADLWSVADEAAGSNGAGAIFVVRRP